MRRLNKKGEPFVSSHNTGFCVRHLRVKRGDPEGYPARFEAGILSGRYCVRSGHRAGNENEWHGADQFAPDSGHCSARRRCWPLLEGLRLRRVRKESDRQLAGDSDSGIAHLGVRRAGAMAHCSRDDTCQPVSDSAAAGRIPKRTQWHSPQRRNRRRSRRRPRGGPLRVG